ncbi:MAG: RDD family protein [Candidatus Thermoplasmatota archaeon]
MSEEFDIDRLKDIEFSDNESKIDNLNRAGFTDRYAAFRVDGIILFFIFFTIFLIIAYFYHYISLFFLFFIFLFIGLLGRFLYFFIFDYLGRSLGKDLMGLKVVDRSGQTPSLKQALIRNIERLIWSIPILGQFILYFSIDSMKMGDRRFGDEWAGTYVVEIKDRSKKEAFNTDPKSSQYMR